MRGQCLTRNRNRDFREARGAGGPLYVIWFNASVSRWEIGPSDVAADYKGESWSWGLKTQGQATADCVASAAGLSTPFWNLLEDSGLSELKDLPKA